MKILTITLHSSQNPGSTLQAFALQHFLIRCGYEAEIIDYRPRYISAGKNKIRNIAGKVLFWDKYLKKKQKFNQFSKKYMRLTPEMYKNYRELKSNPPEAEVYIAGSDQIWNCSYPCGNDKAYYLGFAENKIKMSYAASIGKKKIPQKELKWICDNIKDFSFISVREESSEYLLKSAGIKDVQYVCDPVLLVNKTKYEEMKINPQLKDYIAVYLVGRSKLLDKTISLLKKKYGCKVVLVGGFTKRCDCDVHIKDIGPCDFLGLISNAEFVVASSFHATVFAHIFKKDFAVILPEGNGARIEQFLQVTNLTDRIIRRESDISKAIEKIDFTSHTERLNKFVDESKKVFIKHLEDIDKQIQHI